MASFFSVVWWLWFSPVMWMVCDCGLQRRRERGVEGSGGERERVGGVGGVGGARGKRAPNSHATPRRPFRGPLSGNNGP